MSRREHQSQGSLQQEIRQSRPFRSTSQEAMLGLLRTTDLLKRKISKAIEAYGITMQQYNVLRILRGAGDEGVPTLTIAERMIEQTPGITRLLDRLEKKDLVDRCRAAHDRRQVFCRITSSGLSLLREMDKAMDELDDQTLAMLPEEDQRRLIDLLDRVRAGCSPSL